MEGVRGVVLRKETGTFLWGSAAPVAVPACGAAAGLHGDAIADPSASLGQAVLQL